MRAKELGICYDNGSSIQIGLVTFLYCVSWSLRSARSAFDRDHTPVQAF